MTRPKCLPLLFAAAATTVALAAPAAGAEAPKPWDERAVPEHLDFEDLVKAGPDAIAALIDRGEALFVAKFTTLDGVGRPGATQAIVPTKRKRPVAKMFQRTAGLDANACSSCHNAPVVGGAGDFTANAFVTEGFESADFDSLDPQFSNERGTNHLQGSGLVELVAREMTLDLVAQRRNALRQARTSGANVTAELVTKGVRFGRITARPSGLLDLSEIDGVDTDLVIRPFSQKGVMTSLRQFTVNAMNHHHGMQADERFGARWTGTPDFDGDGVEGELTAGDISALVAWQATLAPPVRRTDLSEEWRSVAAAGETLFGALGCAECHRPSLPLESAVFADPGPFDAAGTLRSVDVAGAIEIDFARFGWFADLERDDQGRILVPLFGDLKRHRIADPRVDRLGQELLSQRFVDRDVFMTSELWGVGSTAPYGHRGDITTLDEVIRAHGGDATEARKAYEAAAEEERSALIAFLKTLVIAE